MGYLDNSRGLIDQNTLGKISLIGATINTALFLIFSVIKFISFMNITLIIALIIVVSSLIALRKSPRRSAALGLAIGAIPLWLPAVFMTVSLQMAA
jgi:hypothetical protein